MHWIPVINSMYMKVQLNVLLAPGFLVWGITEQDIILAPSVCAL